MIKCIKKKSLVLCKTQIQFVSRDQYGLFSCKKENSFSDKYKIIIVDSMGTVLLGCLLGFCLCGNSRMLKVFENCSK